jgi:ubiquinone/menaquinone biosynthesis C-methylase UbiE
VRRITHPAPERGTDGYQRHYWDQNWSTFDRARIERAIRHEFVLSVALRVFEPGSRLLEAGCGTGKYCWALRSRGYRVVGLDFSHQGLRRLRDLDAESPAVSGSVLRMPIQDASFDGALSLGVVEHFEEGPAAAVRELARVIRPGGVLLITVPFQHALWDLNDLLWPDRAATDGPGRVFYQYLQRREEIENTLRRAGLEPREVRYVTRLRGLQDFYPFAPSGGSSTVESRSRTSPSRRADVAGRLKGLIKSAAPSVARSLRDLQISAAERLLPGRIFGHSILVVAVRQSFESESHA